MATKTLTRVSQRCCAETPDDNYAIALHKPGQYGKMSRKKPLLHSASWTQRIQGETLWWQYYAVGMVVRVNRKMYVFQTSVIFICRYSIHDSICCHFPMMPYYKLVYHIESHQNAIKFLVISQDLQRVLTCAIAHIFLCPKSNPLFAEFQ